MSTRFIQCGSGTSWGVGDFVNSAKKLEVRYQTRICCTIFVSRDYGPCWVFSWFSRTNGACIITSSPLVQLIERRVTDRDVASMRVDRVRLLPNSVDGCARLVSGSQCGFLSSVYRTAWVVSSRDSKPIPLAVSVHWSSASFQFKADEIKLQ